MPLSQPAPLDIDVIWLNWGPPADVEELLALLERVQPAEARTVAGMGFPAARAFLSATTPEGTYQVKTGFVQGAAGGRDRDHARMDQHHAGGSLPSSGENGGTLLPGR